MKNRHCIGCFVAYKVVSFSYRFPFVLNIKVFIPLSSIYFIYFRLARPLIKSSSNIAAQAYSTITITASLDEKNDNQSILISLFPSKTDTTNNNSTNNPSRGYFIIPDYHIGYTESNTNKPRNCCIFHHQILSKPRARITPMSIL